MKKSLMGIGELFSKTWEIYKKNFWKLIIIGVICFGLTYLALMIGAALAGISILPAVILDSGGAAIGLGFACFVIIFIAFIVISTLGQVTLIFGVKESSNDWQVKDAFKKGWSKLLSCLWVSVLVSLIILACFGLSIGLFVIAYFTQSAAGLVLLPVGLCVSIPLAIICFVWFLFSLYVVVCEGKRGGKALSRSKELIKGHWWPVFGRFLLLLIIYIILSAVANGVFRSAGPILLNILFTPFSVIYCYLVYKDLKEIKSS